MLAERLHSAGQPPDHGDPRDYNGRRVAERRLGVAARHTRNAQPPALPQPLALGPVPSALGPRPCTLSPWPSALYPQPLALGPRPSALGAVPLALSPRLLESAVTDDNNSRTSSTDTPKRSAIWSRAIMRLNIRKGDLTQGYQCAPPRALARCPFRSPSLHPFAQALPAPLHPCPPRSVSRPASSPPPRPSSPARGEIRLAQSSNGERFRHLDNVAPQRLDGIPAPNSVALDSRRCRGGNVGWDWRRHRP